MHLKRITFIERACAILGSESGRKIVESGLSIVVHKVTSIIAVAALHILIISSKVIGDFARIFAQ